MTYSVNTAVIFENAKDNFSSYEEGWLKGEYTIDGLVEQYCTTEELSKEEELTVDEMQEIETAIEEAITDCFNEHAQNEVPFECPSLTWTRESGCILESPGHEEFLNFAMWVGLEGSDNGTGLENKVCQTIRGIIAPAEVEQAEFNDNSPSLDLIQDALKDLEAIGQIWVKDLELGENIENAYATFYANKDQNFFIATVSYNEETCYCVCKNMNSAYHYAVNKLHNLADQARELNSCSIYDRNITKDYIVRTI